MAQKVVTTFSCDQPHRKNDPAATGDDVQTYQFSLDGVDYETELCPRHRAKFDSRIAKYVDHARRVKTQPQGRTDRAKPAAGSAVKPPHRKDSAEIRAWAKQRGYVVNERGRIPAHIVADYDASRSGTVTPIGRAGRRDTA